MEIRIGIVNTPREISFETAQSAAEVEKLVSDALNSSAAFISLSDDKGKSYLIPTATLAFVEIGGGETRRVGFVG